jgi:hypothetical protein
MKQLHNETVKPGYVPQPYNVHAAVEGRLLRYEVDELPLAQIIADVRRYAVDEGWQYLSVSQSSRYIFVYLERPSAERVPLKEG